MYLNLKMAGEQLVSLPQYLEGEQSQKNSNIKISDPELVAWIEKGGYEVNILHGFGGQEFIRIAEKAGIKKVYKIDDKLIAFIKQKEFSYVNSLQTLVKKFKATSQFGGTSGIIHYYPEIYKDFGGLVLATRTDFLNQFLGYLKQKGIAQSSIHENTEFFEKAFSEITSSLNQDQIYGVGALLKNADSLGYYLHPSRVVLIDDSKDLKILEVPKQSGQAFVYANTIYKLVNDIYQAETT